MPDNDVENVETEGTKQLKLPNMNEFSPGVLEDNNIKHLLAVLHPHEGNKEEMVSEIAATYPKIANTPLAQRSNRANNILIGMSQCGLLSKDRNRITGNFTHLAIEILSCEDDAAANSLFAKYLLTDCYGLELFDVISVIRARSESVSLQTLREELRTRGFTVTENEGNVSKIRLWLESTGVIDSNWIINDHVLHSIIGATSNTLTSWNSLGREQRLLLEQLRNIDIGDWIPMRHLKNLCEQSYGRNVFPEGHLRSRIVDPLITLGWLEARGTGAGRGGDSGDIRATDQLRNISIVLPLEGMTAIPIDLRNRLSTPLEQIFRDLESRDTHVKGIALELLALRLTRDIGLFPFCFRERSSRTGGAEVDVIANGVHLHYSRWLIQCKNTSQLHVSDVAKEVGMATVLKAHVIAMVTTGRIGSSVKNFANELASSSSLQVVLVDKSILQKYRISGGAVVIDSLRDSAYHILKLKESQIREYE